MKKLMMICIFACSTAFADTTVFGLELGKTTEKELQEMYPIKCEGTCIWNCGRLYSVSPKSINFKGLSSFWVVFDKNESLVGIEAKLPKEKFYYLQRALESKYKLLKIHDPVNGDKFARYYDGSTEILLQASRTEPDLQLFYRTKKFKLQIDEFEQQEQSSEKTLLC